MSIIARAPAAALLTSSNVAGVRKIPQDAAKPGTPCILTVPGAANLELKKLTITATGWVQPNQDGFYQIGLLAQAYVPNTPPPTVAETGWTFLGFSVAAHIGQATDPVRTQWMLQGVDMMYFLDRGTDPRAGLLPTLATGKLQGEFSCNIADSPQAPIAFTNAENVYLMAGVDPVIIFALTTYFVPSSGDYSIPALVQLSSFILTGDE
jgi:hypothetical protein